ncbi:alpha/beta hydrolase [Psychrosphaera sp.]|nr:alpha/beta hydrolase [Psychrosphaera sp.]
MKNKLLISILCCSTLLSSTAFSKQSFVKVDDIQYEVHSQGQGENTIVFESGFGTGADTWDTLIDSLGSEYKTIAYSRVGTGQTKPSDRTLTIEQHISQLHRLTKEMGLTEPFTLVGHSYGGLVSAEFARQHPTAVKALILIDPAVRAQRTIFKKIAPQQIQRDDVMMLKYMPKHLADDYQLLLRQMDGSTSKITPIEKKLPVVLLTSTKVSDQPFVFEETKQGKAAWLKMHNKLFENVEVGYHYRINDSGHSIHKEKAEAVVNAIAYLLQ